MQEKNPQNDDEQEPTNDNAGETSESPESDSGKSAGDGATTV